MSLLKKKIYWLGPCVCHFNVLYSLTRVSIWHCWVSCWDVWMTEWNSVCPYCVYLRIMLKFHAVNKFLCPHTQPIKDSVICMTLFLPGVPFIFSYIPCININKTEAGIWKTIKQILYRIHLYRTQTHKRLKRQNTTCTFLGWSLLSCYKMTLKQQLNRGEKMMKNGMEN